MQTYESIFIAPADIAPQRLDDFIEKIKGLIVKQGGEIKNVDKWGRRRLAYPIHRHREGFYTLVTFNAPTPVLAELTQFYRVSDQVVRQMTCKAPVVRPVPPRRQPAPAAAPASPAAPAAKESHGAKPASSPSA